MDNLASVLQNPAGVNPDVKAKGLRLVQEWAEVAEAKPQHLSYVVETYRSLESAGLQFPPLDRSALTNATFVETMTAPEWTDSDVCMRCRTAFSTFNRKHHCRNCGEVFCQDCSSKNMALPWFGVGQDVRVCEACFTRRGPTKAAQSSSRSGSLSRSKSTHVVPSGRGGVGSHQRSNTLGSGATTGRGSQRNGRRRKEEDDIALAIKLSLEASGGAGPSRPEYAASSPSVKEGRPTRQSDGRMMEGTDADDDPDLAAAIAASLRDYAPPAPSAPAEDGRTTPRLSDYIGKQANGSASQQEMKLPLPPSLELPAADVDALLTFSQDAAAQEAYARRHGQWPANSSARHQAQILYEQATSARPRMAKTLDEATRRQGVLSSMHDKLSEAVRLYDRLLDAQMSRPVYTPYGTQPAAAQHSSFGVGQQNGLYSYAQQYAQWDPRQYQQTHPVASPMRASAPSISPPSASVQHSMYPSLPSQQQVGDARGSMQSDYGGATGQDPYSHTHATSPSPYPSPYETGNAWNTAQSAAPHATSNPAYYAQADHDRYGATPQPGNYTAPQGQQDRSRTSEPPSHIHMGQQYQSPTKAGSTNHAHWQARQALPSAPMPTSDGRVPSYAGLSSPMQTPSHEQPLHKSMASLGLNGNRVMSPQSAGAAHVGVQGGAPVVSAPPTGTGTLSSAGMMNGPALSSSGWRGIPITQTDAQPSPIRDRHDAKQSSQEVAPPPATPDPVLSPGKQIGARNEAVVPASESMPSFAMPPPPPQYLPPLASPPAQRQQQHQTWTRPVEAPLIDL